MAAPLQVKLEFDCVYYMLLYISAQGGGAWQQWQVLLLLIGSRVDLIRG